MTHLLGVDLGERRIGLAIGGDGQPARPLDTIRRARAVATDVEVLRSIVAAQSVDELVVGLPLHANGDEGVQAVAARSWAAAVSDGLGIGYVMRDERLSSHVAEERIGRMPRGRAGGAPTPAQRERYRARVDREAAAVILQDELDTRAGIRSSIPRAPDPSETNPA